MTTSNTAPLTYLLFWTSGDGQADLQMGKFATADEARAHIEAAHAELLSLCHDADGRLSVNAGSWSVMEARQS